jgi:hypothetical protein
MGAEQPSVLEHGRGVVDWEGGNRSESLSHFPALVLCSHETKPPSRTDWEICSDFAEYNETAPNFQLFGAISP